ncbi:Pathogenesis-related thaumatin superfamily protein [Striga hermonthica]|uniref:Pathogenesis-related thaumatin superfamily protein n=1 Tax=Striga hermonthica TaxID=68872 RepID=A0A9N7NJP2_STRHE|nr:Pathogenesis-related thaumatin superfamily protein [Striga hermonthica]
MSSFILAICILYATTITTSVHSATFTIKNNCPYQIWPATLTGRGSAPLTGFELAPNAARTIDVPSPWSGRIWARTRCSNGGSSCLTGDCGSSRVECNGSGGAPPASLIEFTLGGDGGKDFYDISLVDGFNLPVSVGGGSCPSVSCPADINAGCPNELAVKGPDGGIVGCKSACVALNQPQYCCTGAYGSPDTCKPTSYSQMFKSQCPQAYSYAYDDKTSTFTCPTGANYVITFCP